MDDVLSAGEFCRQIEEAVEETCSHWLRRSARHIPQRRGGHFVLLLLGSIVSTVFALRFAGHVDRAIILWPASGMVIALALPVWNSGATQRLLLTVAAVTGTTIGGLISGQPLSLATTIGALTGIDMVIACAIMSPSVRVFEDLKRRMNMLRFVTAATFAPMITGALGALPVSSFIKATVSRTAISSTLADSLGMAVVLPATLFLTGGEYRHLRRLTPHARRGAPWAILFVCVAWTVFWQDIGPFLFVIFPPMMLLLLALGLEGAVFTSVALTAIGWFATAHGHGPIMLMAGASPDTRLLVLQVFVWVSLATALPVGALLDERSRAERSAEEAKSIYQILLQNAKDTIVLSALDGSRRYASPAITTLTGWTPEEYIALKREQTYHPDDREAVFKIYDGLSHGCREQTIRFRLAQKGGGFKWVESTVRAYGDEIAGYVGTIRDISALRRTEENWSRERRALSRENQKMASLAQTDPLTGLLNRRGLDEGLRQLQNRSGERMAILMIDVDYFKLYNDTYGHPAGDQCLVRVAEVLRARAGRRGDLVSRFGGEEFALVLPGADATGAFAVAEEVRKGLHALALPHVRSPRGILTASMGIASTVDSAELDCIRLLEQADRALYRSKHSGRDCASVFDPAMELLTA